MGQSLNPKARWDLRMWPKFFPSLLCSHPQATKGSPAGTLHYSRTNSSLEPPDPSCYNEPQPQWIHPPLVIVTQLSGQRRTPPRSTHPPPFLGGQAAPESGTGSGWALLPPWHITAAWGRGGRRRRKKKDSKLHSENYRELDAW